MNRREFLSRLPAAPVLFGFGGGDSPTGFGGGGNLPTGFGGGNPPAGFPSPKFRLGQFVVYDFTVEDSLDPLDGQTFRNRGVVTGLHWRLPVENRPYWSGWIYQVKWIRSSLGWHLDGYLDELPEKDLGGEP